MGIEELRLVLDMVSDVSGGAWWIAVFWVFEGYFRTAVLAVLLAYVVKAFLDLAKTWD